VCRPKSVLRWQVCPTLFCPEISLESRDADPREIQSIKAQIGIVHHIFNIFTPISKWQNHYFLSDFIYYSQFYNFDIIPYTTQTTSIHVFQFSKKNFKCELWKKDKNPFKRALDEIL
jgi:hypothetical protein